MTQKQIAAVKKGLPFDWRIRLSSIYAKKKISVELQHFTDVLNGKVKNPKRLKLFLESIKKVKQEYQEEKKLISELI